MLGLAGMVAANAAVFLGASEIVRRAGPLPGALGLVGFLLARFLLISTLMLLAGTAGLLHATALGIAGIAALAALLMSGAHRRLPRLPRPEPAFAAAAGLLALRLLLQIWFYAPCNSDAVSYHLTKIPEWVRASGFVREMGVDTLAPLPSGFELIETWWVVFLHHDVLIEMAGAEFVLLFAAGGAAVGQGLGFSPRSAAWGGLACALIPGIQAGATSGLNDVPVAALVLATFALLFGRAPWAWVAAAAGLGLGIKPTYGFAAPGFLLLAWLLRRETRPAPGRAGLLLMALPPAVFWYVRNLVWFGNPLHPVGSSGLHTPSGELKVQFGPSLANGVRNLGALLGPRLLDAYGSYDALSTFKAGWGLAAVLVGGVALPGLLRANPRSRPLVAGLAVSLISVLFLVHHDPWYGRFVLFFPAVLVLGTLRIPFLRFPLGLALVVQFAQTCFPTDQPIEQVRNLARMSWRDRSMGPPIPGTDPVLFRCTEPDHHRGESYLLYRPDYSRAVVFLRSDRLEELREAIRKSGARFAYVARLNPPEDPLIRAGLEEGVLRPLGDGRFAVVR
jgi:hypothetical protein